MATAGSYGGVLSYERGTPASWNQAYRQEPRERKMRKVTGRLLALYCSLEIEKSVLWMENNTAIMCSLPCNPCTNRTWPPNMTILYAGTLMSPPLAWSSLYRGTSLIRNSAPLGPYSRTTPGALL